MREEDYEQYGESRKDSRAERKRRTKRDRSKYKKTDADQLQRRREAETMPEGLTRGRVVSIVSSQEVIVNVDSVRWNCILRGVLKKERTRNKNLVAVGDWVGFEPIGEGEGAIAFIEQRKSVLSRADSLSQRKEQIIATNVDQVLITVSVVVPPLKPALVDRYIIAARQGNMRPVVVVNKVDLLNGDDPHVEEQRALYEEMCSYFAELPIPFLSVSADTDEGLDLLREVMKERTSVFSGQSGVGKSSLINAIAGTDLEVGETVRQTLKGAHTTTRARLLELDFGGWCVDTPGIKSFGVWQLDVQELEAYFPEIKAVSIRCRYPDCSHSHEEQCAVKEAVEEETISPLRYESYLVLYEEAQQETRRR